MSKLRIGIDLGGTKIEGVAMDARGLILHRLRIDTPKEDYDAILRAVVGVVDGSIPSGWRRSGFAGRARFRRAPGFAKTATAFA